MSWTDPSYIPDRAGLARVVDTIADDLQESPDALSRCITSLRSIAATLIRDAQPERQVSVSGIVVKMTVQADGWLARPAQFAFWLSRKMGLRISADVVPMQHLPQAERDALVASALIDSTRHTH